MKVVKTETEAHEPWTILPTDKPEMVTSGGMNYSIALDPDRNDNRYLYFIVVCTYDILVKEKIVFSGETQTVFTIENNKVVPSVDFLYDLVLDARLEFIKSFKDHAKGKGELDKHQVPPIREIYQTKLRELLQKAISKAFPGQ